MEQKKILLFLKCLFDFNKLIAVAMNIAVVVVFLYQLSRADSTKRSEETSKKLLCSGKGINSSAALLLHAGLHQIHNMFVGLFAERHCLFFEEADIDEYGKIHDYGLYVIKNENTTLKIRDSGRDGVLATDGSNVILIGGQDGIYRCNCFKCESNRYGNLTDSIIGIVMENRHRVIYALNEEKVLYKITKRGKIVTVDKRVQNAQQIVMDRFNNLYYVGADQNVYIVKKKRTKKVKNLEDKSSYLKLLKPLAYNDVVPIIVQEKMYVIYPNATMKALKIHVPKGTLLNMEHSGAWFEAYQNKIYAFSPRLSSSQKFVLKK